MPATVQSSQQNAKRGTKSSRQDNRRTPAGKDSAAKSEDVRVPVVASPWPNQLPDPRSALRSTNSPATVNGQGSATPMQNSFNALMQEASPVPATCAAQLSTAPVQSIVPSALSSAVPQGNGVVSNQPLALQHNVAATLPSAVSLPDRCLAVLPLSQQPVLNSAPGALAAAAASVPTTAMGALSLSQQPAIQSAAQSFAPVAAAVPTTALGALSLNQPPVGSSVAAAAAGSLPSTAPAALPVRAIVFHELSLQFFFTIFCL